MPAADTPDEARGRLKGYWIVLGVVLFAVAMGPASFRAPAAADWLNTYVLAAQQMIAHQPIHTTGKNALGAGPFTYPPAAALLAIPVAATPQKFALAAWYFASVLAMCVAVRAAWRLAGGSPVSQIAQAEIWILAFGLLLGLRYLTSPFGNRQTDMFVAGAVLGGCWLLAKGRDIEGAIWLGAATAIKCTPLLFAPYLAWRGRWISAAVVVAVALALNYVPDLVWPQASGQSYLTQWRQVSLAPVREGVPGEWFADRLRNQSIAGLVGRLATFGPITRIDAINADAPTMSPARARATRLLTYGIGLGLLAITAWRFGWRTPNHRQVAIEFAAVICLMLLLSPMTSKSHLCVLILPLFLVARAIVERRTTGWILLGIALVLTGPLAARDLIGRNASDLTMAWGLPVLFVFLNLAAMWKLAHHASNGEDRKREAAYATAEPPRQR